MTLDEVVEGHTAPIEFVVLDVEGHELAVLEGFDLGRWSPTALVIEDNTVGGDQRVRRHLEGRGYSYVLSLAQNDLFLRQDEIALRERLRGFWDDLGPV